MVVNILGLARNSVKKHAEYVATKTLEYMKQPEVELSIKFVSPKEIQRLNKQFRNIDKVTDVLSFPATNIQVGEVAVQGEYLGDMALCLKQAKKQAKENSVTFMSEIKKLVIHSVLHLLGYDHIKDEDYNIMQPKEDEISKNI